MPKLFSYGTLQQENVQRETFGRRLDGQADALPGFRREMLKITDPEVIAASGADQHPIVVETGDPSHQVHGTVFDVTEAEVEAADTYEVSDYKRIGVRLASGVEAWVYVKA